MARVEFLFDHLIHVDDTRCFDNGHRYPATDELQAFFEHSGVDCRFEIADHVIRITRLKAKQKSVAV